MSRFFVVPIVLIFILSLTSCSSNDHKICFTAEEEFMSEVENCNNLHNQMVSSAFNIPPEAYRYSYEKKEAGFS